jgi:predicted DNA-binding antitoxin AbrB/MazE fold protein
LSPKLHVVNMNIKAAYKNKVLKLLEDLDLPEKTIVSITIRGSFSDLPEELDEPGAREDIDAVLKELRT